MTKDPNAPHDAELLDAHRRLLEESRVQAGELARVSHDLRGALHVALGHVRILLRGARGPLDSRQRESVEAIERQLAKMAALIEQRIEGRSSRPPEAGTGRADAGSAEEAPVESRPLVLVAEDDAETRALIAELLAERYSVVQTADGEEALRAAFARPPDLVLLDLFMPRLDGFAALEVLRRDPRTSGIPVILLSARSDDPTKVRGLDLGAADYLVKPFSGAELLARAATALRQKRQREHFEAMAQTDDLTGLPNYRAFRARLDEEIGRSVRYRTPLSLVMIDLDNLKKLNDEYGHVRGNEALGALAAVIRQELRAPDFAARYGGDEFVVILPHTEAGQGATFAERLRAQAAAEGADLGIPLSVSLGVAQIPPGEVRPEMLLEAADRALYHAKHAGRNRVEVAEREEDGPLAP